ncbi:hypothetical protein HOY82DRAFT_619810 [Tuber indicum]|nr:hypothetical protein HOY82DRAFT_619810 [Tuber indicum]
METIVQAYGILKFELQARPESTLLSGIITDYNRVNFERVEYELKDLAARDTAVPSSPA